VYFIFNSYALYFRWEKIVSWTLERSRMHLLSLAFSASSSSRSTSTQRSSRSRVSSAAFLRRRPSTSSWAFEDSAVGGGRTGGAWFLAQKLSQNDTAFCNLNTRGAGFGGVSLANLRKIQNS